MGYFNFYLLKKFIFKYKKFFISLLFFIIFLFIKNKCFGAIVLTNEVNYIGFSDSERQFVATALANACSQVTALDNITPDSVVITRSSSSTYLYDFIFYNLNSAGYLYTTVNPRNDVASFKPSLYNETTNDLRFRRYRVKSDGSLTTSIISGTSSAQYWPIVDSTVIGTSQNIYTDSSLTVIAYPDVVHSYTPIQITNNNIPSWNFSYMNIIGDDLYCTNSRRRVKYDLYCLVNNGNTYIVDITSYGYKETSSANHFEYIDVPRNKILTNYNLKPGDVLDFYLRQTITDINTNNILYEDYNLGSYTLTITSQEAEDINNQANKDLIYDTTQAIENVNNTLVEQTQVIQEGTEATEHLENTITDDTVESGAEDLPSVDVTDPTENGIDNIFQSIYNAFCTGNPQDIVFPIPFTNKNITLSPYYVRDMLNNNGASWVYTLIQAFWGYLIGRYIVKDISRKITKIKSGDIENIENSNIKEEML